MKEKEHPLIDTIVGMILFTILAPVILFFSLIYFDKNIANCVIAASTFGLFIAATLSMFIAFTDFIKRTKPTE